MDKAVELLKKLKTLEGKSYSLKDKFSLIKLNLSKIHQRYKNTPNPDYVNVVDMEINQTTCRI